MANQTYFITGIGTDVGKTIAAAIVTKAFDANYWKPVQAGIANTTDKERVQQLVGKSNCEFFDEIYLLNKPASPHIAAVEDDVEIDLQKISAAYHQINKSKPLVIEGAGGLLVPLNKNEFIIDLIKLLDAKVILVSRNYLGSINHSLLTAQVCKANNIDVAGWIFNDQYLNYEDEIVQWSGYKKLTSIPFTNNITTKFVEMQAKKFLKNFKP